MKIRDGFVSNSSSSSFVLIGFKVFISELEKKYEDYDIDELIESSGLELDYRLEEEEDVYYVGKTLFSVDDSDGISEIDLSNLEEYRKELEEYEDRLAETFNTEIVLGIYGGITY